MQIELDFTKSIEENAAMYFEEAKRAKKKILGAKKALEDTKKKLSEIDSEIETEAKKKLKVSRKREWYEKFRWFVTSNDLMFIAGRDATTNEILIKKYLSENDIVSHSEMAGSPFGILKTEGVQPAKLDLEECAQFIACYCKVWKTSMTIAEVFYVQPDQVTKEAPSGEYIGKGSFMIYGKKNTLSVPLKLYLGKMQDGKVMSGPENAVKKHCSAAIEIMQGNQKLSEIAKKVKHLLDADDLDDIVKVLPVGSSMSPIR